MTLAESAPRQAGYDNGRAERAAKPFYITGDRSSYTYIDKRGKAMMAIMNRDGDILRTIPHPHGGATASTPQSAASQAAMVLRNYLQVAPEKNYAIVGTIPVGVAGGAIANVTWQQQIPIVPAFCDAIDYEITLPVTLTLPANTNVVVSPYAPFAAMQMQLTLGGAPPWPMSELTPWHIDETFHRNEYDPSYHGMANLDTGTTGPISSYIIDQGPTPILIGGTNSLTPGATVSNTGGSTTQTPYVFQFTVRQVMKRKRHLLWGAIPFGDPENRPNHLLQVAPLIGTNPEQNMFVNVGGTGTVSGVSAVVGDTTATLPAAQRSFVCKAIYRLSYIDLLPPSMQQAPTPAVTYGLQLTVASPSNLSVGSIYPMTHRVAQVYTAIHHLCVWNQAPQRPDYFGLWDDQDQQSSRWNYDAQNNTFNEYFTLFHRIYRRYPYMGHYVVEMDDGEFPEVPSVTPLQALMTPDASYATAFNLPVTPAMTTAVRVPSGTTINAGAQNNPYVRLYEYGLVRVPY